MDFGQDFCNGLVLSPLLFTTFLKYADPLYDAETDQILHEKDWIPIVATKPPALPFNSSTTDTAIPALTLESPSEPVNQQEVLQNQLNMLRLHHRNLL